MKNLHPNLKFAIVILALVIAACIGSNAQTAMPMSRAQMEKSAANPNDFTPVNAASQMGYMAQPFRPLVAQNALFTLYGSNLTDRVWLTDASGSTSKCTVTFWSPSQVNIIIPGHVKLGNGTLLNVRDDGSSQKCQIEVWPTLGGLFTMAGTGVGAPASYVVRTNAFNGTSELSVTFDSISKQWVCLPIEFSDNPTEHLFIAFYGTGFRNRMNIGNVTIHSRGKVYYPLYANRADMWEGVDQINVELPKQDFAGAGEVVFEVRVNGVESNRVTLHFK